MLAWRSCTRRSTTRRIWDCAFERRIWTRCSPRRQRALFATLVENLDAVAPTQRLDVTISGSDRDYLLFDWLKELLYHFDAEHLLLSRFEVRIGADGLQGSAWGEPLDPRRHELAHEVKAITYHGLHVEEVPDGWLAEVIVDI